MSWRQKNSRIQIARNPSLGEAALKTAVEDLGDKRHSEIVFHRLDITNEQSCSTFREFLKAKHGTITALINNAGFAFTVNYFLKTKKINFEDSE
jgi:short-subunit dehydrogenase